MIEYNINAMVVATIALSATAAAMAWCMALAAVSKWAEKKGAPHKEEVAFV